MTEKQKRELLQAYISGTISPEDRHALEVEAVDDIFLFEALEGYSTNKDIVSVPYSSKETARVLPIRQMLTMAASFVLIAAIAFIFNQYNTPTMNEEAIVQFDKQQPMPESSILVNEVEPQLAEVEMEEGANEEPIRKRSKRQQSTQSDKAITQIDTPIISSNAPLADDPPAKQTILIHPEADVVNVADESELNEAVAESAPTNTSQAEPSKSGLLIEAPIDSLVAIAKEADFADQDISTEPSTDVQGAEYSTEDVSTRAKASPPPAKAFKEMPSKGIRGIVRALDDGEPLIGANVQIDGTDSGVITDIDGTFLLANTGSDIRVHVNYTGFESALVTLSANEENEIFLESGQLLDEVVVTGHSTRTAKPFQAAEESYPYVIKGIVKSSENGNRLVGANISIPFAGISTVSDKYGRFTISFPKPRIKLRINHNGYQARDSEIYYQQKERRFMNIELTPNGFDISEDAETHSQFFNTDVDGLDALKQKESFPSGGWTRFIEELAIFKDSSFCTFDQIEMDFQIQKNGRLKDFKVQYCSYSDYYSDEELEGCFQEFESFIKDFETWETIPPNIILPQSLIISQDTIDCRFGFR